MKAEVIVNDQVTLEHGLHQGCTVAPTLFNLHFNLVTESWRQCCHTFRVDALYNCGGQLVGERTRRHTIMTVTELLFADIAAVVSATREGIERTAHIFDEITSEWG